MKQKGTAAISSIHSAPFISPDLDCTSMGYVLGRGGLDQSTGCSVWECSTFLDTSTLCSHP